MSAVTLLVTFVLVSVTTTVQGTENSVLLVPDVVQSNPWGLPSAIGESCRGLGPDGSVNLRDGRWLIDRTLESVCGPRQIFCKSGIVDTERYCSDPLSMFVADNSDACYKAGSDEVAAACGVEVQCSETEMKIVVDESAIWYQTASLLQLNTNHADCKSPWIDGKASFTISLGDENDEVYWSKCGIVRTINSGLDVTYRTDVMRDLSRIPADRYTETHNTIVTREKCFMIHAKCQYAANGYVTGSFRSAGANAIVEEDEKEITFDLTFMDESYTTFLDIPSVYTSDPLYARGFIVTSFHPNLKASLRTCWATNFATEADVTAGKVFETYDLVQDRCELDSTFDWVPDTDGNAYTDDFTFDAFRFFSDANNYEQDIWIHCTIVACDRADSTTAYCTDACASQARRARRAIEEPSMVSKMSEQKIVHNARYLGDRQRFFNMEPTNVNTMFAYGLFAVGGVVAVASVALGIILLRGQYMSERRYKQMNVNA